MDVKIQFFIAKIVNFMCLSVEKHLCLELNFEKSNRSSKKKPTDYLSLNIDKWFPKILLNSIE